MEYKWDEEKSIQENAEANGISYGAMGSYKATRGLKCASFKDRRLKTCWKLKTINFLYREGFKYCDIARLFKVDVSAVHSLRIKYL